MESGWIKLYRKMLDNPVVCKDAEHIAVWIYLLLNATHKEVDVLLGNKKVRLKPGQLITGRKKIASQLKISESKVQRILCSLESEQQIEQQMNSCNRLITIVSWEAYQKSEQQSEQQVNTNKNNKKYKEERNINNIYNNKFNLIKSYNNYEQRDDIDFSRLYANGGGETNE